MSDTKNTAIRNDHWTIIDGLGFGPTGDQLAKLIMLAEPPFAAGVTGKWGSGRTSLMRYAMARLGGRAPQLSPPGECEGHSGCSRCAEEGMAGSEMERDGPVRGASPKEHPRRAVCVVQSLAVPGRGQSACAAAS